MGSLRTSFQVSRSIRVWCLWPTLTESPGARDLTDSPRDAPSTTSRALASPSGDLSSTSPPDHPTRLLLTAPTALLDTLPSPRTTVSSPSSSLRSFWTEPTILTQLLRSSKTWAQTFKFLADQDVLFEGILLKPSMVTPGADNPNKVSPETVAEYTLKMLNRRVPPAVPGIMFLSGGQSEMESTLNLNAMNQTPNPWHVSFSY